MSARIDAATRLLIAARRVLQLRAALATAEAQLAAERAACGAAAEPLLQELLGAAVPLAVGESESGLDEVVQPAGKPLAAQGAAVGEFARTPAVDGRAEHEPAEPTIVPDTVGGPFTDPMPVTAELGREARERSEFSAAGQQAVECGGGQRCAGDFRLHKFSTGTQQTHNQHDTGNRADNNRI